MEMLLCRLLGPLLVRFPTGWGADRCSGLSTTSDLPSRVAGATALCLLVLQTLALGIPNPARACPHTPTPCPLHWAGLCGSVLTASFT